MRIASIIFALFLFCASWSCAQQAPGAEAPAASLKDLRWHLNTVLSQQLSSSLPDSLNGKAFRKSFSFNYKQSDGGTTLEVRELRRTVVRDSTFGGSIYQFALQDVDLRNVKITTSSDEKYTALVVPALPGKTFLHSPYGQEPARQVAVLTIGWYDRVQDRTLARALVHLQDFLEKLSAE